MGRTVNQGSCGSEQDGRSLPAQATQAQPPGAWKRYDACDRVSGQTGEQQRDGEQQQGQTTHRVSVAVRKPQG